MVRVVNMRRVPMRNMSVRRLWKMHVRRVPMWVMAVRPVRVRHVPMRQVRVRVVTVRRREKISHGRIRTGGRSCWASRQGVRSPGLFSCGKGGESTRQNANWHGGEPGPSPTHPRP